MSTLPESFSFGNFNDINNILNLDLPHLAITNVFRNVTMKPFGLDTKITYRHIHSIQFLKIP
jgi:hypothetical protein